MGREGVWITVSDLLDKVVGFENLETGESPNRPKEVLMAFSVTIGLFVGLIVGGASMAIWAARRIGDEAARQFDRGFERGRWLADLSTTRGLEAVGRSRRMRLILPGDPTGMGSPEPPDPPAVLMPQRFRPAEPRTYAGPPLADH
jgi:hypothetical protein